MYVINSSIAYYSVMGIKYSTLFIKSSLIDLFSYELPSISKFISKISVGYTSLLKKSNQVLVTIFFISTYSMYLYLIFYIFCTNSSQNISQKVSKVKSIENLFFNANWLERESSEMTGIFYTNKIDCRNLLLMYGDVFFPLLKFFSSIGIFEFFYNIYVDILVKKNISTQN